MMLFVSWCYQALSIFCVVFVSASALSPSCCGLVVTSRKIQAQTRSTRYFQTSQRTLEEGLHGVQSRLTEIEVTLASPKQDREKLEQVTAMSKDIKSLSKKIDM